MSTNSPEYTREIPENVDPHSIVRQIHPDSSLSYLRLPEKSETRSRRDLLTEGLIGAAAVGIVGGVGAFAWRRIAEKIPSTEAHSTNDDASKDH